MGFKINNIKLEIEKIIERYRNKKGALIPLLQDVQEIYGYVPKDAVFIIAKELSFHPVDIFGILSFYSQFYMSPRGKNTVKVCLGTACHVMGGGEILNFISGKLGINEGETTEDGVFTLERVACLGCCGMSPVVSINDDFYGRCEIKNLGRILESYNTRKSE